jgi:hypothetical protein
MYGFGKYRAETNVELILLKFNLRRCCFDGSRTSILKDKMKKKRNV